MSQRHHRLFHPYWNTRLRLTVKSEGRQYLSNGLVIGGMLCLLLGSPAAPAQSREWEQTSSANQCTRTPFPPFTVGTNVLHRPSTSAADQTRGTGYGSAASNHTLTYLGKIGMAAIVLPVPIHLKNRDDNNVRPGILHSPKGHRSLKQMIQAAHQKKLRVVLVPHLSLDDGEWRGELMMKGYNQASETRTNRKHVDRFFRSYLDAILPIAKLAEETCVEVFSFGLELKSISGSTDTQDNFSMVISTLRKAFRGQITYSANWDEVHDVLFWPQLDTISINAFFPLSYRSGAKLEELTLNSIHHQEKLKTLRERTQKKIWFLEVGYKSTTDTALEPWVWPQAMPAGTRANHLAQKQAYQALVSSLRQTSAVDAVFFWAIPSDAISSLNGPSYEPSYGFSYLGKPSEFIIRDLIKNPPSR
jgi:hypothetical protein